jgi:hypothetical protein
MLMRFCFSSLFSIWETHPTTFGISDPWLLPALAHVKWQFCFLLPAEKHGSSSFHQCLLSFVACCSWSPAMLIVIQVNISEVCTVETAQHQTVLVSVYTIIILNNFQFPMDDNQ